VTRFAVHAATLDDVFLALTGRDARIAGGGDATATGIEIKETAHV
jgi:hypothetical protein